jgi:inner membrane protein
METNLIKSIFQSATAKMIMVGLLTLFLLIPLEYVKSLINERSQRKQEVVDEVAQLWGREVQFYGPILRIPYNSITETTVVDEKTKKETIQKSKAVFYAYFFPEKLNNQSNIAKNTSLKRGIYNNVVFTADMNFDGYFSKPNFEKLNINPADILWDKATIIVKTTNLKSIKSDLNIKLNSQSFAFESKQDDNTAIANSNTTEITDNQNDVFYGTLETNTFDYQTLAKTDKIDFKFNMKYNGSNAVKFIPVGKTTTIALNSDWESPSFEGAFAANDNTKTISTKGFHADWKIIDINRPFAQQHDDRIPNLNDYAFGVKLIETVDQYQQNERASKYGFLVIGLTFLIFFLLQSISKISIHIFQYTMIGLALIMFYTLLISITEHSSFAIAYIIAATAVVLLISLYSVSILQNKKFPAFIGLSLTALYTFIFVIIQLENYALLVGSIGLFAILATIMYFSRKIEWNK